MNTAAMRTFSPAPAARTPAGALACHGYQEPHALPTGALRTCRSAVGGMLMQAPARSAAPRACCTDRCHQGRRACPCPQACELPADAEPATPLRAVALRAAAAGAFVLSVVLLVVLAAGA